MGRGVNEVTLVGNLGADPEVRYTQSGAAVCNLRLAVGGSKKVGDRYEDVTEWFSVTAFGKSAESIGEYLHKGSRLYVRGRGQTREYENKDGVTVKAFEVVANDTVFLDPPPSNRPGNNPDGLKQKQPNQKQPRRQDDDPGGAGFDQNGDLPF